MVMSTLLALAAPMKFEYAARNTPSVSMPDAGRSARLGCENGLLHYRGDVLDVCESCAFLAKLANQMAFAGVDAQGIFG